jgi:hypothetical protein
LLHNIHQTINDPRLKILFSLGFSLGYVSWHVPLGLELCLAGAPEQGLPRHELEAGVFGETAYRARGT